MARTSQTNGDLAVQAVGLTKVFSDFWMRAKAVAVDGIDFEIRQHEILVCWDPTEAARAQLLK